jgi:hypothetical protein
MDDHLLQQVVGWRLGSVVQLVERIVLPDLNRSIALVLRV